MWVDVLLFSTACRPKSLEVTANDELVVMQNLDIFRSNGFNFLVDDDAPATKKLKLTSHPFSFGTSFGLNGMKLSYTLVDELTFCRYI